MYLRQPPSPCIGICRIDQATGWCQGCLRTLQEIADWPLLSVREKDALLLSLAERGDQRSPVVAVLLDHGVDEFPHVVAFDVYGERRRCRREQQYRLNEQGDFFQCGNNLRCVCMDMRIPKLAIMVTMDVPP